MVREKGREKNRLSNIKPSQTQIQPDCVGGIGQSRKRGEATNCERLVSPHLKKRQ